MQYFAQDEATRDWIRRHVFRRLAFDRAPPHGPWRNRATFSACFLFSERRCVQPVRVLSGGERNRYGWRSPHGAAPSNTFCSTSRPITWIMRAEGRPARMRSRTTPAPSSSSLTTATSSTSSRARSSTSAKATRSSTPATTKSGCGARSSGRKRQISGFGTRGPRGSLATTTHRKLQQPSRESKAPLEPLPVQDHRTRDPRAPSLEPQSQASSPEPFPQPRAPRLTRSGNITTPRRAR